MTRIEHTRHPYHDLLKNGEDIAIILQSSKYDLVDYDRLLNILQEKRKQRQLEIYRDIVRERSREYIVCENDRIDEDSAEELTRFMHEVRIVDFSSSFSGTQDNNNLTTPIKASLPIPLNPATSIHTIVPPLPFSNSTNSLPSLQHLAHPSLISSTSDSTDASYRIVFEYFYVRVSLTYSFLTVAGRRHRQQMIVVGMIELGEDAPEEATRERSVDIRGLYHALELRHASSIELGELLSRWFSIFNLKETVVLE